MALRLLVYVGLLYQDLLRRKELPADGRLPPILPIMLYHGTPAWTGAVEFRDRLTPACRVWNGISHAFNICC